MLKPLKGELPLSRILYTQELALLLERKESMRFILHAQNARPRPETDERATQTNTPPVLISRRCVYFYVLLLGSMHQGSRVLFLGLFGMVFLEIGFQVLPGIRFFGLANHIR